MMDFENLFGDDESFTEANESALNDMFDLDELDAASESAIFMEAVADTFDDPQEFVDTVMENAVFWETYGLIESAEVATEAVKRFQVNNWKQVNFERLWKREAIRIEARKDSSTWKKYSKYRGLMRQARAKIFQMNENAAKRNVRQAMANSQSKASAMKTSSGNDLKKRLDTSINKSANGTNPTNVKKPK